MKNLDKGSLWVILTTFSAIFAWLIIVAGNFPYLGMAISLATLSSLVFIFKKDRSNLTLPLYLATLIFSFFIFYNANAFLTFLNILSVFLFGSFMAIDTKDETNLGFISSFFSPVTVLLQSFKTKSDYFLNTKSLSEEKSQINEEKIFEILKSVIVSLVALLIIIPLLASSNPLFNKLILDLVNLFNLQNFLDIIIPANIFIWFLRIGVFLILALFIPRFLTYINSPSCAFQKIPEAVHTFNNLLLPKILVAFVIFVFFITQAQLYFSTDETLQVLGYTNSQYAREVFTQLSLVAFIIFGLVYNDKNKRILSKLLTYILVLEGFFLTFMALKSVYDYSSNWGFTYKRLWGFTGVIWILGTLSFFLFKYYKNLKDTYFIKGIILFSSLVLIGVNLANFDSLIFNYRKSVTHLGVDYLYLSGLSSDAQSYDQLLFLLENEMKQTKTDTPEYYSLTSASVKVTRKIERLQRKYRNLDLRTLNISEYLQYQKIKSIDIQKYQYLRSVPPVIR